MNHTFRIAALSVLATSAIAVPTAYAQSAAERDSSGAYISGSYGGYKAHGGEFDDENDLLGVALGYQFNPVFGLEAEYIDFGNFGNDDVEGKLKGVGLSALRCLPARGAITSRWTPLFRALLLSSQDFPLSHGFSSAPPAGRQIPRG